MSVWQIAIVDGFCMPTRRRRDPFEAVPRGRRTYKRARGRVWKTGSTWYFEVTVNGVVVNADNTGHWRTIFDGCNEAVFAFERVASTGQPLKSWASLVARADS